MIAKTTANPTAGQAGILNATNTAPFFFVYVASGKQTHSREPNRCRRLKPRASSRWGILSVATTAVPLVCVMGCAVLVHLVFFTSPSIYIYMHNARLMCCVKVNMFEIRQRKDTRMYVCMRTAAMQDFFEFNQYMEEIQ